VHSLPAELRVWWVAGPLALALSAGVAFLSWTLVEKKVLDQKTAVLNAVNWAVSQVQAVLMAVFGKRLSKG
jgi:hypothetical protein